MFEKKVVNEGIKEGLLAVNTGGIVTEVVIFSVVDLSWPSFHQ